MPASIGQKQFKSLLCHVEKQQSKKKGPHSPKKHIPTPEADL